MQSDAELLETFVATRSNEAFALLVQRHLSLVYGTAMRRVGGNVHLAEDVSQMVFTLLARRAAGLRRHPVITGWLHLTTHHFATKAMRTERRRLKRELLAEDLRQQSADSERWDELRPVIDEALVELPESDRVAILLRYFQEQSYVAIGTRLGLSENAARMRTDRALDSLRASLARRGVTSTAAILTTVLDAEGTVAVPAGLGLSIAGNATAAGGAGFLFIMSTSTLKVVGAGAALLAGVAVLVVQQNSQSQLRQENASLRRDTAALRVEVDRARRAEAAVRLSVSALAPSVVSAPAATDGASGPAEAQQREERIQTMVKIMKAELDPKYLGLFQALEIPEWFRPKAVEGLDRLYEAKIRSIQAQEALSGDRSNFTENLKQVLGDRYIEMASFEASLPAWKQIEVMRKAADISDVDAATLVPLLQKSQAYSLDVLGSYAGTGILGDPLPPVRGPNLESFYREQRDILKQRAAALLTEIEATAGVSAAGRRAVQEYYAREIAKYSSR
jgi:RNA polymerase sigma factor (sigma-70 family)